MNQRCTGVLPFEATSVQFITAYLTHHITEQEFCVGVARTSTSTPLTSRSVTS
ncbi:MAG: hypothetical protein V7L20_02735 [Nostoc sp.]